MAAPITIHDLPDDMLHEIFERVFLSDDEASWLPADATMAPTGPHRDLHRVCRRWRDISGWVRLAMSRISINTAALADVDAVRPRYPAAFKDVMLNCFTDGHSTSVARAASSLINSSADLRRALSALALRVCCLPALSPAVTPITSCTSLTKLELSWSAHENERVAPSNMISPLSALQMLETLEYRHALDYSRSVHGDPPPESAMLAPLPTLPDAPRLTYLSLHMSGNFVPVGSDAALGRLRRLDLWHVAPVQELLDAEDPFLLRTAFDAGTWQPSRLTGLQELKFSFNPVRGDLRAPLRPSPTGSQSGSEWASLVGQVTTLSVRVGSSGYRRPSTGIVAGLGVLTVLRSLRVHASTFAWDVSRMPPDLFQPVSIYRVRAPHLTRLAFTCTSTPVDVAQFRKLVDLELSSISHQPPLNLLSLVARSSLKRLVLFTYVSAVTINLAELFVGGAGWPVLEELTLREMNLKWDEKGLAGAPTAVEFAGRARQLLPALASVVIRHVVTSDSVVDTPCCQHVVPALRGLQAGGGFYE